MTFNNIIFKFQILSYSLININLKNIIKVGDLSVNCPERTYVNASITCGLYVPTFNITHNISVDFGDGDISIIFVKNVTTYIYKNYTFSSIYNITATIIGTEFQYFSKINGKIGFKIFRIFG